MGIQKQGIIGERLGLQVLQKLTNAELLMQPDWLFKVKGKWNVTEVKNKQRFIGRKGTSLEGYEGQGLNLVQVNTRLEFQKDTGIRCLFVCFEPGSRYVYMQWLDTLENTNDKLTFSQSGIRIYNLQHFVKLDRFSL